MKNLLKKPVCCLLAILFCAGVLLAHPQKADAKTQVVYQTSAARVAAGGTPVQESFTMPQAADTAIIVVTAEPTDFTLSLYKSNGSLFASNQFSADDTLWHPLTDGSYGYPCVSELPKGSYSAELTFADDIIYGLVVTIDTKSKAALSHNKLPLTIGFSKTLKVTGNSGKVSWKSSKPSIATVNSSGKVTAKKTGNCTITASVDGKTLKCSVSVKTNVYSIQKHTNADLDEKLAACEAYQASFDSSGNLKIKMQLINNTGNYARYLSDLRIQIKDASNKTVCSYKASKVNVSVADHDRRDFSITIKKKDLKGKKIDLRNVLIHASGHYVYLVNA